MTIYIYPTSGNYQYLDVLVCYHCDFSGCQLKHQGKMSEFDKSAALDRAKAEGLEELSRAKRYDGSSQYSREKHRLFLSWLQPPDRQFLAKSEGLGNSQKAEVAWLERKGYPYSEMDISLWLQPRKPEGPANAEDVA